MCACSFLIKLLEMDLSSADAPLAATIAPSESYQLIKAGIFLAILLPILALILVSIVVLMSAEAVAKLRRRRRRALKRRMQNRLQDLMQRLSGLEGRLKRIGRHERVEQMKEMTTETLTASVAPVTVALLVNNTA